MFSLRRFLGISFFVKALETQGIFRIPGNQRRIVTLKAQFETGLLCLV